MVEKHEFDMYRRDNDLKVDQLRDAFLKHSIEGEARDTEMLKNITELQEQMKNLVDMWSQARGVLTFVKIMAAIVAACATAWTFLSQNITWRG